MTALPLPLAAFIALVTVGFMGVITMLAMVGCVLIEIRDVLTRGVSALEAATETTELTPVVGFHVPDEPPSDDIPF